MVIAIDKDESTIRRNKENCNLFRMNQKIEHINDHFTNISSKYIDTIFLNSPENMNATSTNFFSSFQEDIAKQIQKAF